MEQDYVVITGSSSGIGCALAQQYAKNGQNLILVARRIEKLNELKQAYPKVDIQTYKADLSDSQQVRDFYEFTKRFRLVHFINNAGFGDYAHIVDADINKLEQMIKLNITALTILSSLFLKDYANQNVILTNISSIAGYAVINPAVTYSASKYFVSAFTEGLAKQFANASVKIKLVAPAATESEFVDISCDTTNFDYKTHVPKYHTAAEMADFIIEHAKNEHFLAIVDTNNYTMEFKELQFPCRSSELIKN